VIEERPGQLVLHYEDWTDDMKALSVALAKLPKRTEKQHDRRHDLGIDRLSHYKYGRWAIRQLTGHAPELEVRAPPTGRSWSSAGRCGAHGSSGRLCSARIR
jgi:hypothetical protein